MVVARDPRPAVGRGRVEALLLHRRERMRIDERDLRASRVAVRVHPRHGDVAPGRVREHGRAWIDSVAATDAPEPVGAAFASSACT